MAAGSAAGLALSTGPAQAQTANQQSLTSIEPNTIKRRGVGFRGYDPQRAFQGSTLFAPLGGNMVYLVDLQGKVEHLLQSG